MYPEPVSDDDFRRLDKINKIAFALWNIDGQHENLPTPPFGSGCSYRYCWMPVAQRHIYCSAHGGQDLPLPERK